MASSIINSDDGVVSGTSGLKTTGGDDGVLVFQSKGTETARITATGNVGIGTNSPDSTLDITAANPFLTINGTAATSGDTGIAINANANKWIIRADNFSSQNNFNIRDNATGTPVTRLNITSSGNLQFNSGYGSVATAYGCRAWVNFNGTGTVAIREDGNVSSITDNGTGAYTVNFTTALPDANYAVNITGDSTGARIASVDNAAGVPTTSAVRVGFLTTGGGAGDPTYAMVSVFR